MSEDDSKSSSELINWLSDGRGICIEYSIGHPKTIFALLVANRNSNQSHQPFGRTLSSTFCFSTKLFFISSNCCCKWKKRWAQCRVQSTSYFTTLGHILYIETTDKSFFTIFKCDKNQKLVLTFGSQDGAVALC